MIRHYVKQLATYCLDLLFPVECVGCHAEGAWLCTRCTAALPVPSQRCPFCRNSTDQSTTCPACRPTHALDGLFACTIYRHPTSEAIIHGLKYRFWSSITSTLADRMADSIRANAPASFLANQPVLIPVPLHPGRERWRGFNQATLLANALGNQLKLQVAHALVRNRKTAPQAKLAEADRAKNIAGAFSIRDSVDLSGKTVIIVDDVSTTGSTLDAAAQACKAHGAHCVWSAVFARGRLGNTV